MNLATATHGAHVGAPAPAAATDSAREESAAQSHESRLLHAAQFSTPPRQLGDARPRASRSPRPIAPRAPGHSAEPSQPIAMRREHRLEREDDRRVRSRSCAPSPRSARRRSRRCRRAPCRAPSTSSRASSTSGRASSRSNSGSDARRHGRCSACAIERSSARRAAPPSTIWTAVSGRASWPRRAARDLDDGERVEDARSRR